MDALTLGILSFTIACVLFGFLLGLIRGCNRSILRLVLIIVCAVGAFLIKDVITNSLMALEIDGKSIAEILQETMAEEGQELPESITNFVTTMANLMIGIVSYFIVFFALQGLTWLIIFPIFKIFIKKGKKKRALAGGIVGLVQGVIVAFVICAPLTGMLVQVDKINTVMAESSTEQEQTVSVDLAQPYAVIVEEVEEEGANTDPMGTFTVKEFLQSPIGKMYNSIGNWYFDFVATTKDADGKELKLSTVTDVLTTIVTISTDVVELENNIKDLADTEMDSQQSLNALGEILIDVGENIENLDNDGEELLDTLLDGVKEWLVPADDPEVSAEVKEAFDNLTVENLNLTSVGEAFIALSHYTVKVEDPEVVVHITQEDANAIVEGISDNPFIMDMIGETVIVELDEEDTETFTNAIENITDISAEDKAALYNMFNINIA